MNIRPGKAVVNGELQYLSVSQLEKFDGRSMTGCNRKWWYRYVAGMPEPTSKSMQYGIDFHKEIETYLRTGVKALSPLALRTLHLLPKPSKNLWLEQPIHTIHNGKVISVLTAAGVPFMGQMDIVNREGTNQGTSDIAEAFDPPGTVEVIDLKWKGNATWRGESTFKKPDELIKTIQMAGYGEFVRRSFSTARHVRLSHVYAPVKGGVPTKVTRLHVVEDCAKAWEYAEALAGSVKDVARETDVERVPVNLQACGAYGGCPYLGTCSKNVGAKNMGLLDDLKAEEKTLKAEVKAQQATTSALAATWAKIKAFGRGYPALNGQAALECRHVGIDEITGAGQLGALTLMEVAHIYQLADELASSAATTVHVPEVQLQPVLPPDAPPYAQKDAYVDPEAPAKKRGRKPKAVEVSESATETEVAPAVPPHPTVGSLAPATVADSPFAEQDHRFSSTVALQVFVDCVPNVEYKSLHDYIDVILSDLVERHCKDGIRDVRCASNDSPLAFGKWRGVLAHAIRENPPARGSYILDTRGSEIAEVAADALRSVATVYVRGLR